VFIDYWFLLPLVTLAGGLFALAPLGVHVLRRGVVFIDLAVAQAAAASTLWLQVFYHTHDAAILVSSSVLGALICAVLVARITVVWPERREALIGLIYVLGAALGLMAAQFNPHGKDDLQQLLAADILWSEDTDALLAVLSGLAVSILNYRRKSASAVGGGLLHADLYFYSVFAIVTSLLVQSLGVFLVFVFLIAPALLRELFGAISSISLTIMGICLGLALSWILDAPSGVCVALTIVTMCFAALMMKRPPP
jgi:zinc/manganese transport system permease protein